MHRLFGKSKPKVEAPTLSDTSQGLSNRMTDLDKKIAGLDNELRRYKEQMAKANAVQKKHIKKRAMDVLKRKRMYEAQRDQLASQQFNIDQTSFAIETVQAAKTTVTTMQAAAKSLKKENKKINLNELEDMQDEMEDMLEDVGEISEILGRSYGVPDDIDEEELDAELDCLEEEWADEGFDVGVDSTVPTDPNSLTADQLPSEPTLAPMPGAPSSVFTQAEASANSSQQMV